MNVKRELASLLRKSAKRARRFRILKWLLDEEEWNFIDSSDPYTHWLRAVNMGWLHSGNLYCFDYAIQKLPSEAPILEIGCFCGLSSNLLTYYKQKHKRGNRLIGCGDWSFGEVKFGPELSETGIAYEDVRSLVKESYLRNVRLFSRLDLPFTVDVCSGELFGGWTKSETVTDVWGRPLQLGGKISFCYIDGNHSYEYANRDFVNCDNILEQGGFILFDDSSDLCVFDGVRKLVAEVGASGKYDLIVKDPNYLFRKKL